jgi:hypothetical protein
LARSVRRASSYPPFSDRCKEGVSHDRRRIVIRDRECHLRVESGKELRADGTRWLPVTTDRRMPGEIHDLASFVNRVTLDGKPRPADEAINQLQEILTNFQTTHSMRLATKMLNRS